jgi:hypothetical protein
MKPKPYFSADIAEFLFLLAKHHVCYLIVGGEAVIYYGYARLTGDIDLLYERTEANATLLFDALKEFWASAIPGIHNEEELRKEGMVFQFGIPPNRIDLLNSIDGVEFGAAWKNKKLETLSRGRKKFAIYYVGVEELIRNKKAVNRDKDKDDLRFLTKAKRTRANRRS